MADDMKPSERPELWRGEVGVEGEHPDDCPTCGLMRGEYKDEECESQIRASMECPVCGIDYPHSHTVEELSDRPYIHGARAAFERTAGAIEPLFATKVGWSPTAGWRSPPERVSPGGAYTNGLVDVMWRLWRAAWIEARRGEPIPEPAPRCLCDLSHRSVHRRGCPGDTTPECERCGGTGNFIARDMGVDPCPACHGTGRKT